MKRIKTFIFFAFLLILCTSTYVFSEDNDIFGECSILVEPNILLIIDSSGSMSTELRDANNKKTTRIEVAKIAVKNIIDNYGDNNRFGIMKFNGNNGGTILSGCEIKDNYVLEGGSKYTGTLATDLANYKTYLKGIVNGIIANGNTPLAETLFEAGRYFAGEASVFHSGTYTSPQGIRCRKNYIILMTDGEPTQDTDQIQGLRINNIKIDDYETDTYPTFYDSNDPELHNVAELLFKNDINKFLPAAGETTFTSQNVLTYPIGFGDSLSANAKALLQDTADKGQGEVADGGLLGDASSALALEGVFDNIMAAITETKTTFAAPIVPIAASSNAYAGNYIYLSMFKPDEDNTQWVGNLKKYKLNSQNQFTSCGPDDEDPILNDRGIIKENAKSCWSAINDGPYVAKGGAGDRILANTRNIIYNDTSGTNGFKSFSSTNLSVSDFSFGSSISLTNFIKKIKMDDEEWKLYDLNHSKPAIAKTSLGSYLFVGSNGGMLHCIDDIYGNEKWAFIPKEQFKRLHKVYASDDHYHFMDGSPTVADIIPDADNYSDIVICGERRGGNHYYAIDISGPLNPKYKYTYTVSGQSWKQPDFVYYKKNAASTPTKSFLLTGGYDERYDHSDTVIADVDKLNHDADPNNDSVVLGGEILIINASDGTLIKRFNSGMEASIVSAWGVDVIENDNDAITQIYAADLEGTIFGLRDNDPTKSNLLDGIWQENHLFKITGASTGKKIFSEPDFVQEFMHYYDSADKKWKPVVGDFVYFGTGDRADPLDKQGTTKTNYFYCVKNDWVTQEITTTGTVSDYATLGGDTNKVMVDVTNHNVYQGVVPDQIAHLKSKSNRGWYIKLEGAGEKCLSKPVVYAGVVYFTTYIPPTQSGVTDPCGTSLTGGIAQIYALDYKTGGAVFNFDKSPPSDPTLTKSDRARPIIAQNVTIPPDFVIVITEKGAKGFVGPEEIPVREPNNGVNSFYWKTL